MQSPIHIDDLLCFAVYSANHAIARLYRKILGPLGLTYPQYLVLVALWHRDDRKVNDLGDTLQLDSNTLTPLLKRMEAAGFLTRTRNPDDERSLVVSLTDKGQALKAEAAEISSCVISAMGGETEGLAALRDQLQQLTQTISGAKLS